MKNIPVLPVSVLPGDVFGTENPAVIGVLINAAQKFHARDNASVYTHSGIITNTKGDTVESLWTVRKQNIFAQYVGKKTVIARYLPLMEAGWAKTQKMLAYHLGQRYPWWRLFFHTIPPVAKYLSFTKTPVCSELVAKAEYCMGARHRWWTGTNPDTLADEWHRWKGFKIIFEGLLPKCAEALPDFSSFLKEDKKLAATNPISVSSTFFTNHDPLDSKFSIESRKDDPYP